MLILACCNMGGRYIEVCIFSAGDSEKTHNTAIMDILGSGKPINLPVFPPSSSSSTRSGGGAPSTLCCDMTVAPTLPGIALRDCGSSQHTTFTTYIRGPPHYVCLELC